MNIMLVCSILGLCNSGIAKVLDTAADHYNHPQCSLILAIMCLAGTLSAVKLVGHWKELVGPVSYQYPP